MGAATIAEFLIAFAAQAVKLGLWGAAKEDAVASTIAKLALAGLCACAFSAPVLAAELGRVQLNGRTVVLNDDFTWAYDKSSAKQAAGGECSAGAEVMDSQNVALTACLDAAIWQEVEQLPEHEKDYFTKDGALGLAFINEKITVGNEALREQIVLNAAAGLNVSVEDVDIRREEDLAIGGAEWRVIEYGANFNGVDVVFVNHFRSVNGFGTAQIVFYTNDNLLEEMSGAIDNVLAGISVGP